MIQDKIKLVMRLAVSSAVPNNGNDGLQNHYQQPS